MTFTGYSPLTALFTVAPGLRRAGANTLSLYLPTRTEGYDARYYDIVFGDVLHRYRERLGEDELEVLVRELPVLRSHVAAVRPAGCTALAAFAEAGSELLETVKLPLPVVERLQVGDPLLAPALRQIEARAPACVVVVDKERALTFGAILDETFQLAEVVGAHVSRSRAGGTSAASNQRKADNRARSNLLVVVEEVVQEMLSGAYARLYIAGPQEARARFVKLLPENLRLLVAGYLSISLDSATVEADVRRELSSPRIAA